MNTQYMNKNYVSFIIHFIVSILFSLMEQHVVNNHCHNKVNILRLSQALSLPRCYRREKLLILFLI